jgi:hypothetical protein
MAFNRPAIHAGDPLNETEYRRALRDLGVDMWPWRADASNASISTAVCGLMAMHTIQSILHVRMWPQQVAFWGTSVVIPVIVLCILLADGWKGSWAVCLLAMWPYNVLIGVLHVRRARSVVARCMAAVALARERCVWALEAGKSANSVDAVASLAAKYYLRHELRCMITCSEFRQVRHDFLYRTGANY